MPEKSDQNYYMCRQNILAAPGVSLPFYVYGTGITTVKKNHVIAKDANENQYIGLIWILSGYFEMIDCSEKIIAGRNHVFYHLTNERTWMHCISDEASFRWISFDGPWADAFMLSFKYPRHQEVEYYPQELFERLESIITDEAPLQVRRKSALIMEIIAYAGSDGHNANDNQKTVDLVLGIIKENFSNPDLDLEFLCSRSNTSRTHLTRLFKDRVKTSPGRYILNQRLTRAMSLLSGTNFPIGKVAKLCGYRDPITFSRFIKRATGLGPMDYRKKHTENSSDQIHEN